jgi:3-deoxy-7-phosphoheptulonate synthase
MIVVMKAGSTELQLKEVVSAIEQLGYRAHIMRGVERNVIGCLGDERGKAALKNIQNVDGVESVMPILTPYKLAAKEFQTGSTIVKIADGVEVGGSNLLVIAGPCSVESEEQILTSAQMVKKAGANALRGGAFKPRSSAYSFQGLGEEGLKLLQLAKEETGLPIVTEVMDSQMLDMILEYADVLQVGARNMQNFTLLKALGKVNKPILLKRGLMSTVEELLMSAEYILSGGNEKVILCERGIRTFETATRNTLDLNAIPALKARTHLPVIVDPSHGTGVASFVTPLSRAAIAAGADGLIIETHPDPKAALSDGPQSLDEAALLESMNEMNLIAKAMGKSLANTQGLV